MSYDIREDMKARYAKAEAAWPDLPEPVDALDVIAFGVLRAYMDAMDEVEINIWYGSDATPEQRAYIIDANRARERQVRDSGALDGLRAKIIEEQRQAQHKHYDSLMLRGDTPTKSPIRDS